MQSKLAEFYVQADTDPVLKDILQYYDIGPAVAWLAELGAVIPTDLGMAAMNEAWVVICNALGLDPNSDY